MADGREAYLKFLAVFDAIPKEKRLGGLVNKFALAQHDLVVLIGYNILPNHPGGAAIDMFRFDAQGKIIEHWGFWQSLDEPAVPKQPRNSNGSF